MEIKSKISTLWIVIMFTMAFADILTFITPGTLQQILSGSADGIALTPPLLLIFAILTEIPIAMIFLSRALKRGVNRWVNLIACLVTTVYVLGGASFTPHYLFFAAVEVICMAYIVWSVIKWPKPQN